MKRFWLDTLERAIKTAAQTFVATVGITASIGELDWSVCGGTMILAVMLSIATSLTSVHFGNENTASLIDKGDDIHA